MFILDQFFKAYFAFLKKAPQPSEGASLGMAIPLIFNAFTIELHLISFSIDIANLRGWIYLALFIITGLSISLTMRYIYVVKQRALKITPFRFAFIYGLFGVFYFFFSLFAFMIVFDVLFNSSNL